MKPGNNNNWWEEATAADNNKNVSGNKIAWYNQKSKLSASILLWPLWLYGMYKTDLYTAKTKKRWVVGIIMFGLVISILEALTEQQ